MMFKKALALIGLIGTTSIAAETIHKKNLRAEASNEEMSGDMEQLDLELTLENGDRELFPLLPGVKCPTGHHCRARSDAHPAMSQMQSPMANSLKNSLKTPLAMQLDWSEFDNTLQTVVTSGDRCTRRAAMKRAAGMAAGLSAATVMKPAYAAETKEVKMGSDSGLLAFVPQKIKICKGDTITWIMNKAGPHNVVFDEDAIPAGVDFEKISMVDGEQIGDEGETFSRTFDTVGDYAYYCEPHRGAGMNGMVTVA